jgi:tRNA G10  N-methylase Trm11
VLPWKQLLFLFGRTPELSRAEIDRLIEIGLIDGVVSEEFEGGSIVTVERDPDRSILSRLGGTIRVAEVVRSLDQFLPESHSGKFVFGFSYVGLSDWRSRRSRDTEHVRSILKSRGISTRFITSTSQEVATAAVRGNRLLLKGAEFVVVKTKTERIARTIFIHDIDAYTSRDRARPSRDARVGMLPPKLAQILINLALSPHTKCIWDPLAGTGVILQEALLAGYSVLGSDSSPQMVKSATENISWLISTRSGLPDYTIFEHDITSGWPPQASEVDAIISEGYLGPPLSREPTEKRVAALEEELLNLYADFFSLAARHLDSGQRIVICLPFFTMEGRLRRISIIDRLASNTYTLHGTYDYAPHGQIVGRQITIFEKV